MEPTLTGQKPLVSTPKQAAVAEIRGSWGLSMPHPTLRLHSCKLMSPSLQLTANDSWTQRLLVLSSSKSSSWASGYHLYLSLFLPCLCHWLCVYSVLATVVCLPTATWHWNGNESIDDSGIRGRKFTCLDKREFGHGLAALGRLWNLPVSFIGATSVTFSLIS